MENANGTLARTAQLVHELYISAFSRVPKKFANEKCVRVVTVRWRDNWHNKWHGRQSTSSLPTEQHAVALFCIFGRRLFGNEDIVSSRNFSWHFRYRIHCYFNMANATNGEVDNKIQLARIKTKTKIKMNSRSLFRFAFLHSDNGRVSNREPHFILT